MIKKYFSFITFVLALAAFLSFSSLGSAQYLSQDTGGMTHMRWAPIVTANPLPANGVVNVVSTTDGCFEAAVQNATTGKDDYYSLNPLDLNAGWSKVDPSSKSIDIFTPWPSSSMPFAFGPNGFSIDAISLPDAGYFSNNYNNNSPFYEMLFYGADLNSPSPTGHVITYLPIPTPTTTAGYHINVWPNPDNVKGTIMESNDPQIPSFHNPSVFYAFVGDPNNLCEAGHCFYIASALETKSNQYHSLVISDGFFEYQIVDIVADPIAPAGEVIVGVAASPQWHPSRGYVAVAADGTSYFAQP